MKKNVRDKNQAYVPEPGENALELLIKEAGREARKRKKKAMDNHFQKLQAAIRDQQSPAGSVD